MTEHALETTLAVADEVLDALAEHGAQAVIIGALALAIHGYPRATQDVDLAVAIPVSSLRQIATTLEARGYEVQVREPDAQDPLGGVVDIRAPGADLIQLVNFDNAPAGGFPRLVHDAIGSAQEFQPGARLRVADPYHLIVFKLYAGGAKSKLDIIELLDRLPALDIDQLRRLCAGYRLGDALEKVLSLDSD